MGRKKGYNIIDEAHERANNNFNPYYWFNRVTPYTIARMKAEKKVFSFPYFLIFSVVLLLEIYNINTEAAESGISFFAYIFDFSDPTIFGQTLYLGLLFFIWTALLVASIQNLITRITAPTPKPTPKSKKEKKKKHPKHRKDYK